MKGIFSALINSFNSDGSPNTEALKRIIDYNITVCNIDGLYVNGSTGENFNMPHEYKKTIFKSAAESNAGRVTLIAQIGCNVVEEVCELADIAAGCGYNAVSAVTPFYFQYSAKEIFAYYFNIADRSKLPLIIYNIPVRTGVVLTEKDFKTLFSHDNIAGVKFTSNDFFLLERVRSQFPDKILYSGFDEMLLSAAVLGTDGAIGSTYNIAGHWAKEILNEAQRGDLQKARLGQRKLNHVVSGMLNTGALLSVIKAMLDMEGIPCGNCRPPMAPITDEIKSAAAELLDYIKKNS